MGVCRLRARAGAAAHAHGEHVGIGGGRLAREAHRPAHRQALGRWWVRVAFLFGGLEMQVSVPLNLSVE